MPQWRLVGTAGEYGLLTLEDVDQPWFVCRFEPSPLFDGVRPLFEEELRQLELLEAGRYERWEQTYREIEALAMRLAPVDVDATPFGEVLLHVDGARAWFRA